MKIFVIIWRFIAITLSSAVTIALPFVALIEPWREKWLLILLVAAYVLSLSTALRWARRMSSNSSRLGKLIAYLVLTVLNVVLCPITLVVSIFGRYVRMHNLNDYVPAAFDADAADEKAASRAKRKEEKLRAKAEQEAKRAEQERLRINRERIKLEKLRAKAEEQRLQLEKERTKAQIAKAKADIDRAKMDVERTKNDIALSRKSAARRLVKATAAKKNTAPKAAAATPISISPTYIPTPIPMPAPAPAPASASVKPVREKPAKEKRAKPLSKKQERANAVNESIRSSVWRLSAKEAVEKILDSSYKGDIKLDDGHETQFFRQVALIKLSARQYALLAPRDEYGSYSSARAYAIVADASGSKTLALVEDEGLYQKIYSVYESLLAERSHTLS